MPYVDEGSAEELFRHKVLAVLRRRGLLSLERIELLLSWRRSGFSVHNRVHAHPADGRDFEALARYMMRSPVSLTRLRFTPGAKEVVYARKGGNDASEPGEDERVDADELRQRRASLRHCRFPWPGRRRPDRHELQPVLSRNSSDGERESCRPGASRWPVARAPPPPNTLRRPLDPHSHAPHSPPVPPQQGPVPAEAEKKTPIHWQLCHGLRDESLALRDREHDLSLVVGARRLRRTCAYQNDEESGYRSNTPSQFTPPNPPNHPPHSGESSHHGCSLLCVIAPFLASDGPSIHEASLRSPLIPFDLAMALARRALPSAILAGIGTLSFAQPLASRVETLIAEAGNADDEQVRLGALRARRQTPGGDKAIGRLVGSSP